MTLLAGRRGVVLGVSGANSLGYHIARTLHELGAHVTVTCRPARLPGVAGLAADLGVERTRDPRCPGPAQRDRPRHRARRRCALRGIPLRPLASNITGEIVTVDGGFSRAYL